MAMAKAKATREVAQFTDTRNLLEWYQQKFIFEEEGFDPIVTNTSFMYHDNRVLEFLGKDPCDLKDLLKYMSQIRNGSISKVFDLDVFLPIWLRYILILDFTPLVVPHDRDHKEYEIANIVIHEINVDMKSKCFELVEIAKIVYTSKPIFLRFLTLTVKKVEEEKEPATMTIQAIIKTKMEGTPWELQQWRVKPETKISEM